MSSALKTSSACARATPSSSQMLEDQESAFFFCLSLVLGFLCRGVSSSTEGVGDAIPTVVRVGMDESAASMGVPLFVTGMDLAPIADKGLIFLAPHPSIHVLVELHCHFCERKTLINTYPSIYKGVNTDEPNTDEHNTYSFFLQYLWYAGRREMGPDLGNKTQGSADL